MGSLVSSTASPKLPKELGEAWDRYQKANRSPQETGHLLAELEDHLNNYTRGQTDRQKLEDAMRSRTSLQDYLKGNAQTQRVQDKKTSQLQIRVVWDKDKMSETYQPILRQLLDAIHCREIRQEDLDIDSSKVFPTLYVCRTATGRLDIDEDKFHDISDPKALIVLRSGKNESAFSSSYSAGDIVSKETLVVQLLHYDGRLIDGDINRSGLDKINMFARTHRH